MGGYTVSYVGHRAPVPRKSAYISPCSRSPWSDPGKCDIITGNVLSGLDWAWEGFWNGRVANYPRGYCYGVVDAMVLAREAAKNLDLPRPIYILGMIVHNRHVVEAFEEDGIITLDGKNRLELLEDVDEGTVIFTAHGVSPEVRQRAREKGSPWWMPPAPMSPVPMI